MNISDNDARFFCNKLREFTREVDLQQFNCVFYSDHDIKAVGHLPTGSVFKENVYRKDYEMDLHNTYVDYLSENLPKYIGLINIVQYYIDYAYQWLDDEYAKSSVVEETIVTEEADFVELDRLASQFEDGIKLGDAVDDMLISISKESQVASSIVEDLGVLPQAFKIEEKVMVDIDQVVLENAIVSDCWRPKNEEEKIMALVVMSGNDDLVPIFMDVGDEIHSRCCLPAPCRSLVDLGFNYDISPIVEDGSRNDLSGDGEVFKVPWDFERSLDLLVADLSSNKVYVKGTEVLIHSLWLDALCKIDQFLVLLSKCGVYYAGYSEDKWDFMLVVGDVNYAVESRKKLMLLVPKIFKLMVVYCSRLESFDDLFEWFVLFISDYMLYDMRFDLWNALIGVFNKDRNFRKLCCISHKFFKEVYQEEDVLVSIYVPHTVSVGIEVCKAVLQVGKIVDEVVQANSDASKVGLPSCVSRELVCRDDANWRLMKLRRLASFKRGMRFRDKLVIKLFDVVWMRTIDWNLRLFYFVFGEFIVDFKAVPLFKRIKSLIFISGKLIVRYLDVAGKIRFKTLLCSIEVEGGAIFKFLSEKRFPCLYLAEFNSECLSSYNKMRYGVFGHHKFEGD
jgi:hypothetical protein